MPERTQPELGEELRFIAYCRDGSAEAFSDYLRAGLVPGLRFAHKQTIHRSGWWLWADAHNWCRIEDMRRAFSAGWYRVSGIPVPQQGAQA